MPLRLTLRLAPVAAATWISAYTATHLPQHAAAISAVCWLLAIAALGALAIPRSREGRRALWVVVGVVAFAAGGAAASHVAMAQPAREAVVQLDLAGGRAIVVHASVTGKVERRVDGSLAFDAVATRIEAGASSSVTRADVVVRVHPAQVGDPERLDVGAEIIAHGTAGPGRAGDRAVLTVTASRGVDVTQAPVGPARIVASLRRGLVAATAGLPGDGAGLVPGLAVGDTSAVSPTLDAAMKESSLSHLTAVSGANCALVVGLAFIAAAGAGAPRALRALAGLSVLGGFVLLVTPEPSVVRAAAMAAIAMTAVLLGRAAAGMSFLVLGVTALLIFDPWLSASLGFALSAAATGSLLLFARPLATGLARFLPRLVALAISVPLAAQLACGPLLILADPHVPVYGVIANLIAAPAAPVATVAGLAACLAAPLPLLQSGLAAIAWVPASWIAATATTVSGLPGDLLPWLDGWPGVFALAALGGAVGVVIGVRGSSRRRRTLRSVSAAVVAAVVGTIAGVVLLGGVAGPLTLPGGWSIAACDVGQGDALLLRSEDAVALIDTGPDPEALSACLDRVGITRIDLLVFTHFDLDHAGGVPAIVGRVGTVLHGPLHGTAQLILKGLADAGATTQPVVEGTTGKLGSARWRVLWPRRAGHAFPSGNDASVILDVRGGGIPPALLLGDLSASPQRALAASGALRPPYAVVKVAHHGSADQDAGLYELASPAIAVVEVGADNDYGHPRREILEVLTGVGATIARTDLNGLVVLEEGPDGIELWRERGG